MFMANCLVCREVNNFNTNIRDIECAYNKLSFILRKNKIRELDKRRYTREDRANLLKIKGHNRMDRKMCPHCYKMNFSLLELREEQLSNVIITIMANYKNNTIGETELNRAIDILKYKYPVPYMELLKLKRSVK